MINKHLMELMEKIQNNSDYLKNMKSITSSQELYNYCSSIVGGYSKEEFDSFAKDLASTDIKLRELSEDSLTNVQGGTIGDWFKSIVPTMPVDEHDFRLKVQQERNMPDGSGGTKKVKVPGAWTGPIIGTAGYLKKSAQVVKMFELIYFDDLENMPPEKLMAFALDLTDQT